MNTKSGIRWLQQSIAQVALPNGRHIELASREGADDFVETVGTDFISTNLNLTTTSDGELHFAYHIMCMVSEKASPDKIASGIPESELRIFIEHMRDTLITLSTDRNWLRSGIVSLRHELLLKALTSFEKHPSFLKAFVSNEGMEAVAKFYSSRKKNVPPNHKVAEFIIGLVGSMIMFLMKEGSSLERGFSTIEKTGILGQLIRCIPVFPEYSSEVVSLIQSSLQLVKKKLKPGTPTGDILDAVIAGKDGPINEEAKSSLARLQILARLSNDKYDNSGHPKSCRRCEKIETPGGAMLMKCQRCKVTYYCNRECQVAHWKSHKEACNHLGSGNERRSEFKTHHCTLWAFVQSNRFDILKEAYKKGQEYNVPKKELAVEIDFHGDAPALRNEFKVRLTSDFFEESALIAAPGWLHRDTLSASVREEYEGASSNDLLVVCRASNNTVKIHCWKFPVVNTGDQLLSGEAVESIGR
jgi:hypothetical protein